MNINGVNKSSTIARQFFNASTNGILAIGGGSVGRPANGVIDDIRIYNKALTAAEIQKIRVSAPVVGGHHIIDSTRFLAQLANRRMTLDSTEIGSSVSTKPMLRLDGVVIAQSESSLVPGLHKISPSFLWGGRSEPLVRPPVDVGAFMLLSFDELSASDAQVQRDKADLLDPYITSRTDALSDDEQTRSKFLGRMASVVANTFGARTMRMTRRVDELLNLERRFYEDSMMPKMIWTFPDQLSSLHEDDFTSLVSTQRGESMSTISWGHFINTTFHWSTKDRP